MALTSSSRGDKKIPTWLILLALALFAMVLAKAAQSDKVIPINGVPSPSATAGK